MLLIKTKITEERPADVSKRQWPKMLTVANAKAGTYWHKHFFPKHFVYSAKNKYNHQPRTRGYQIRKQRMAAKGVRGVLAPGNVDNVFTGRMKTDLMASMTVRAYPTRASVKMTGPTYALMRPYKSNQPNKGDEMTRVTPDEEAKLAEVLDQEMTKQLKTYRAKRVTNT